MSDNETNVNSDVTEVTDTSTAGASDSRAGSVPDLMPLIIFKEMNNIGIAEYAGFKAELKATDADLFSESDLKDKLQAYRIKPAFKE